MFDRGIDEEQIRETIQKGSKVKQTDGLKAIYTYVGVCYKIRGDKYIIKTVMIEQVITIEKCYICEKGNLHKKKVDYKLYGLHLGAFNAEECNHCGEIFYDEEESKKMTEIAKKKGLWNLKARTKIGEAGTTLDIRLPKKIIDFLELEKGKEVELLPEGKNKLVVYVS